MSIPAKTDFAATMAMVNGKNPIKKVITKLSGLFTPRNPQISALRLWNR